MPGETYNAGTIFLQVVPVFGDVQNHIRRQAKDWDATLGDELEASGRRAGERANRAISKELSKGASESGRKVGEDFGDGFRGELRRSIANARKELQGLEWDTMSDDAEEAFGRIRRGFKQLEKDARQADFNPRQMHARIDALRGKLEELWPTLADHRDADRAIDGVLSHIEKMDKGVEKILDKKRSLVIEAEPPKLEQVERAMGAFERRLRDSSRKAAASIGDSINPELRRIKSELQGLADSEIGIDVSSEEAQRKIEELLMASRRLASTSPDIDVRVDAGAAETELSAIYAQMKIIDGKDIDIKVDVDTGGAVAKMGALRALFSGSNTEAAANSFRSFNAVVLAAVTLLPALIPLIGAVGGALLGLVPILAAVGAGFGSMLIGFSGIGDAVSALGARADNAAQDTYAASQQIKAASYAIADAQLAVGDAERNAARAVADAQRAVAEAHRSAAQAVQSALQQQQDAQEAYAQSVKDVQKAEQDLAEARKKAKQELEDTKDQIKDNALAIRQAQLNAFDATNNLNAVMADGSSTAYDKESAQLAYDQAQQALHELREEQERLAKEKKKQDKEGVNGTDTVQQAQDALTAALQRQKDAQEALGRAAQAVDRARAEGARRVADAVRAQQRAEEDGARNVARAQEQLRRAQENYNDVLYHTGDIGSASMRKVEQAMGKLGPAGKRFARFLFGLRDDWYKFRADIQEALLPHVQRALTSLITTYGPQFHDFMVGMADVTGQFFEGLAASLEGPAWRKFFATMGQIGPKMASEFGQSTILWLESFANIMTAVAPFAERLSKGMLGMSEAVNRWTSSEKGTKVMTNFMEWVERTGPDVLDFLGAFIRAAGNLAKALAPWGDMVLKTLTSLLDWIADMDPETLGIIAGAIIGITVAWQAAVGATAAFFGGMSAFQTAGGRIIFGVVGLAAAVAILALKFDSVREAVGNVFDFLMDHKDLIFTITGIVLSLVAAYRAYVFIMGIVKAFQIGMTAATYGTVASTYALTAAQKAGYVAGRAYAAVQAAINAVMSANPFALIVIAIIALVAVFVILYKKNKTFHDFVVKAWAKIKSTAKAVWPYIVQAVKDLGTALKWTWEKILKPTLAALWEAIKWTWTRIVLPYLKLMVWYWTTVFKVMAKVWEDVLWPTIKAIWVGMKFLWDKAIHPYLKLVVAYWRTVFYVMKKAWTNVLYPVLDLIIHIFMKLWSAVVKPVLGWIADHWRTTFARMKFLWKTVLWPVLQDFFDAVNTLWKFVIKPRLEDIQDKWHTLMFGMKLLWENVLKPMWERMKDGLGLLKDKFSGVIDFIKEAWGQLKKALGEPIYLLLEKVINDGLIDGFNKVADFVGSKNIPRIPNTESIPHYASGGVMPGYTPGRDVHDFYSPTAGRLRLSGGEAVMRPEFTAAVGPEWVNRMNATARASGVEGIRKMFRSVGSYWMGGVIPLLGASVSLHDQYGHFAADLNYPGYEDYGKPIHAWNPGYVQGFDYGRDESYGRGVVMTHADAYSLYAHMSGVVKAVLGKYVNGGTTIGYVGDYGNTGTPPTSHLHFEIIPKSQGFPNLPYTGNPGGGIHRAGDVKDAIHNALSRFPDWIVDIAKDPIGYVKGLVTKPIDSIKDRFGQYANTPFVKTITGIPGKLVDGVKDKVWDILPGPLKSAVGGLKSVGDKVAGEIGGAGNDTTVERALGGILPYNGTMMYDAGGYLPPGLTTVVNLTGKPEPVFTPQQFEDMGAQRGPLEGFTYAPTFNDSDLTSEDVAEDLQFTIRKVSRTSGGKYGRNQ